MLGAYPLRVSRVAATIAACLCLYGAPTLLASPALAQGSDPATEPLPGVPTPPGPGVITLTDGRATPETLERMRALLIGQMKNVRVLDEPRPMTAAEFLIRANGPITFEAFQGHVVLVNFWATWCAPCLRELPSISRLQAALGGADFQVAAINIERRSPDFLLDFLDRRDVDFGDLALYRDPDTAVSLNSGVRVMPTSLLLDRSGQVVAELAGEAEWDSAEAKALIQLLIDDAGLPTPSEDAPEPGTAEQG